MLLSSVVTPFGEVIVGRKFDTEHASALLQSIEVRLHAETLPAEPANHFEDAVAADEPDV